MLHFQLEDFRWDGSLFLPPETQASGLLAASQSTVIRLPLSIERKT